MKVSAAKIGTVVLGCALICFCARPQEQDQQADPWMGRFFPLALNEYFPIDHAEGDFIAVQAHQDSGGDVPEFSLVLENTQSPRAISARLSEAQGSSLYLQMTALHAQQPSASYADLKPAIKVQSWTLSIDQCPAIAAQFKAFDSIQFVRPRDDDPIAEHPVLYQFHESVGGGDSEVTEFVETRAFPRWANDTHKALDSCIASAGSDKKDR